MIDYKLSEHGVVRFNDNGSQTGISNRDSADWADYEAWLAASNVPLPADEIEVSIVVDGLLFMSRVTDGEYDAITTAAQSNVQVRRWLDMLRVRGYIDLGDQAATSAKAALVGFRLLTQERADVVFRP